VLLAQDLAAEVEALAADVGAADQPPVAAALDEQGQGRWPRTNWST
jgi:outer membrane murein-binding lipoprotein Lpp